MNTPPNSPVYLAVDFGAGSGRVIAGILEDQKLRLEEIHRFSNEGILLAGTWHWQVTNQFGNILEGLKKAASIYRNRIVSIGIDTWGVDYGFIDQAGSLLGLPVQYRDSRTDGMMELGFSKMPQKEFYQATGNQFMFYNTVFQMLNEQIRNPERLEAADRFLLMPDLFNYWLTGNATNEATNASTTQLVNAATGEWAFDLIDRLGLPKNLFREIIQPGSVIGDVLPEVAKEIGFSAKVIAVGSHDTASAYAAVPTVEENAVYLSSGTWSLLGTLVKDAVINDESFDLAFTNERAVGGEIRLLKNICGMLLIQECKTVWDQESPVAWETLITEAESTKPFASLIDPGDPRLTRHGNMPGLLRDICKETDQPVPAHRGAMARMIFESMALKNRIVFDKLEKLVGYELGTFHIVGGGCQNKLLNQFTANALNRKVVTGPVEATAAGNILSQLQADGKIASMLDGSDLIKRSFDVETFVPQSTREWEDALKRFETLCN